ncbi:MAG: ATP-binding cassette domain-containing protein [Maricaulaceae bacterium]|jgi:phospholipid/cholesterol/gamma-HCH transport system ATP-binding protein
MSVPKISVAGVSKSFGSKRVLSDLTFDLDAGRSLVIIGGSGSGKSVTLKCILGLLRPDAGSIKVDGEETVGANGKARAALNAKFGMLFQGGALFDSLTIWENVAFRLIHADRVSRKEARVKAIDAMAQVNLSEREADLSPAELSGGMQKRVGLARAIVAQPEIIFFDEPTTGLDPITADVINDLIVHVVKHLGATAVSITHDMHSARKIADDIAMIYEGAIIWRGAADTIDHSGNDYVDQFINGRADGPIQVDARRSG